MCGFGLAIFRFTSSMSPDVAHQCLDLGDQHATAHVSSCDATSGQQSGCVKNLGGLAPSGRLLAPDVDPKASQPAYGHGNLHQTHFERVGVALGSVPGAQTVPRSEITGLLHALRHTKGDAVIQCDNWSVCRTFSKGPSAKHILRVSGLEGLGSPIISGAGSD